MPLSTVIPVFNEAESLGELYNELNRVASEHGYTMQIIFVDDGSSDASWDVIQELASRDDRVLGIRFRRNFGKAAALAAGFDAAEGEIVVTLDADLQDDPAEIPKLLARLDDHLDVVSGWKQVRRDPWHKRWPSKVFNWLVGWLNGVHLHDHNCGFKAYRREVIHEVRLYGELHRFVPVLAASRGFRVGEIPVHHRPRKHGQSKYGISRILKGFLDLLTVKFLTGYGHRPQHVMGAIGLIALLFGGITMVALAGEWCFSRLDPDVSNNVHLHQRAATYYALGLMLIGGQCLSIGLLGEMITAHFSRDSDHYSISEHTDPRKDPKTKTTVQDSNSNRRRP
ncbi:MAG: glycosyltransferase family 2 protein [Pirellulales bacterium]|nr:glycosyltransferase family 2 protein [Pirellulales bacterium]